MSEIDVSLRRLGIGLSAFRAVRPISPKARLGDEWLYPRHLAYEPVGDLAQHRHRPGRWQCRDGELRCMSGRSLSRATTPTSEFGPSSGLHMFASIRRAARITG